MELTDYHRYYEIKSNYGQCFKSASRSINTFPTLPVLVEIVRFSSTHFNRLYCLYFKINVSFFFLNYLKKINTYKISPPSTPDIRAAGH